MLDAIRNHTQGWLAKAILAAITIPFALFGIDSYLNSSSGDVAVAKVAGSKISLQEYGNAMETVRDRLQAQGQKIDNAMLESPAFKQSVLDGLITRRLVSAEIARRNFKVTDDQLNQHILGMPEFQENGKFSEELYQKTLEQNKLTASKLQASIRGDLATQQARDGIARLALLPEAVAKQSLQLAYQQRDAATAEYKVASFVAQTKVTPEQVKAYYEQHKDKFKAPEQVKLEFANLSVAALMPQVSATDEEVKAFYDANADKMKGDEQRHASHILIGFGVSAKPEEKAEAKAKAEDILAQVKKNPKRFEELATKYSQDPGSATKGGDLGNFARGAMVKPFDDAAFSMKVGQISDLVESEFGYHIIRLDGITGNSSSFESMKGQLKADILFQKAQALFAEQAEDFKNIAYEQSGSLQPLAKKFNIQLQTTNWMSRDDAAKFFKSEKVAAQAFSDEVLKEKRNSEAEEISNNDVVSVRALEYKPSAPRSFDEVKGGIEALLKLEQAKKLAQEKGEAVLTALRAGNKDKALEWTSTVTVDRKSSQGLSDAVMRQVFKINTSKLPAYAGFMDENRAYVLVEISRVDNAAQGDDAANLTEELKAAMGAEYLSAYGKSLKSKAEINVNQKLLLGGEKE